MPNWLITGCSSGLGRQLALASLHRGHNVVVTARDSARVQEIVAVAPNRALAVSLDVSNKAQVRDAVRQAEARFGPLDVLINNAGHGYRAAVEEAASDDVDELFNANFFGPVDLIRAVLPSMRAARAGTIVNVTSIAARRGSAGTAHYAAAKAALNLLSDGLRKEVAPLGIKVMIVEPGAFRTDFAGRSLLQSELSLPDYAATVGVRRKENDKTHGTQPGDPARAAKAIIDVIERPDAPFRLSMGSDAVAVIRTELQQQLDELDAWESVSTSSDFPD